jgi:hypothetical protein
MAAEDELPEGQRRASDEPLLSPVRALLVFSVAIVALLGVGGLLVTQLIQTRSGGGAASTTVASQPVAAAASRPTLATAREVQAVRAPVGTPAAVPGAFDRPAAGINSDASAGAPAGSDAGAAPTGEPPGTASEQAGPQPGPAGGQPQTQVDGESQPGEAVSPPSSGAAPAPAGGPRLPTIVNLAGTTIPVGPDGVTQPGALQFAQALAQTVRTAAPQPIRSDAALDDLAQQVLREELASAQQRGFPQANVVHRDGATVRLEVVAVLPRTADVKLTRLPNDIQALGVAAGVSPRVENGYLPDLVVVAAVSYR